MIKIRKGTKKDLAKVLELIKELADYEGGLDEVLISERDLEEYGFCENPLYFLLVAESDNNVVGLAIYFIHFSTWKGKCLYLEDLIVSNKFRRKGIGTMLFETLIKIAHKKGMKRIMWQVLHWNESAINFYKKYNANISNSWLNGKITDLEIKKLFKIISK